MADYKLKPFFLDGTAGRIFGILFEPNGNCRGQVLYCPPFAEEMNKCRRMAALLAQRLAGEGVATLILDLYGTGDSEGDFEDARWDTWISDLEIGLCYLGDRHGMKTSLCGVRLGALLALEASSRMPDYVDQLLMWQPLVLGKSHLTQFLRLKIAAQLTQPGPKTTTKELRAAATNGETIEVAGYALHPDLVAVIDRLELNGLPPPVRHRVSWYEVAANEGSSLAPVSRKLVQRWQEAGVTMSSLAVRGEAFWATQEIGLAPDLIDQSVKQIATD